jgi:hypothetical protein
LSLEIEDPPDTVLFFDLPDPFLRQHLTLKLLPDLETLLQREAIASRVERGNVSPQSKIQRVETSGSMAVFAVGLDEAEERGVLRAVGECGGREVGTG